MVETIVGALIAGAAATAKNSASDAIKGVYQRLKERVRQKVAGDAMAAGTLEKLESDPGNWKTPAEQILTERNVGDDADLVRLAMELLAELPREGDNYNVHIDGSTNFIVGPDGRINVVRGKERC